MLALAIIGSQFEPDVTDSQPCAGQPENQFLHDRDDGSDLDYNEYSQGSFETEDTGKRIILKMKINCLHFAVAIKMHFTVI